MDNAAQLPRIFQANIDRFYVRVIATTLNGLQTHASLESGVTSDLNLFLDRCAAQVDNHTANEAAKAFALTLDGVFERQLARWTKALGLLPKCAADALAVAAGHAAIDLEALGLRSEFTELHEVANVVRHGDGRACSKLQELAPSLWASAAFDYRDIAPGPSPDSEMLRIGLGELSRYATAIICFWGHADTLPGATTTWHR